MTFQEEIGYQNFEFYEQIGEIYSNISFCIISNLIPSQNEFDDENDD